MAATTRCLTAGKCAKLLQRTGNHQQICGSLQTCHLRLTHCTFCARGTCSPFLGSNRREYTTCPWPEAGVTLVVSSATKGLTRAPLLTKCRPMTVPCFPQFLPCSRMDHRSFTFGCTLGVAPNKEIKNKTFPASATRSSVDSAVNKSGDAIRETDDLGKVRNRAKSEKENIMTVPNLLTTMRMFSSPLLGYLVVNESFPLALGIFAFAGLTDLLDGYIARNFKNQMSVLGTALDPLADKLLISILTISLTAVSLIPVPLTALIVARDGLLVGACFYIRYKSLPLPKTVARYFDVTIPSAQLYPTMISKVNTALQLSLVALTLAAPVFDFVDHPFLQGLWYVTGATTFISGMGYLLAGRDCVKILKDQDARKD